MLSPNESIIINQQLPLYGVSHKAGKKFKSALSQPNRLDFSNPDQDEICKSLEGSLQKITLFWQKREVLYREAKSSVELFKKRETKLFNKTKKNLPEIKSYIDGMLNVSSNLEGLMSKYVRMGKEMKTFILDNMEELFTEQHLQEKVRKN